MKPLFFLSGLALACSANAAIIAGYDFTLTAGDTTPAASIVASGVSVSDIDGVGGADSTATVTSNGDNTGQAASGTVFGSTSGGCFHGSSNLMTGTSLVEAITDGDYVTFTVTADVAGTLDLTGLSIDKAIADTFIARVADEWNVLAKVNGDLSAWSSADALLASDLTTTTPQGLTEFESTFIDLSPTSSFGTTFQGIDSVEFRIYLWGSNGTPYSNAFEIDQVVVEGSVPPAPVDRSGFNLAKFQFSSATSATSEQPTQFGNDGFVTQENRWASNSSGPHWYRVILGTPMTIGSAHLYSGATGESPIEDFTLQYYNGSSWVDIAGTSVTGNTLPVLNLEFDAPITAQDFRLYTTDASAVIKELALYAPTTNGSPVPFGTDLDLNIAKQRQFAYSSVAGSNYPVHAIDGYVDDSSAWASTNTAGPHQFQVHFPQSEDVRGIHLYSGFEGQAATVMEDFTVQYYNGSAWVTFSGGSITGNSQENLSLWFDTAVATSKIRVYTTDSKQAVIRELVVFADNGGAAYPLWTDAKDEAPSSLSFLDYEDSYYSIENRSTGENLSSSTTGSVTTTDEPWFQVLLNLGTDTYRLRSKDSEACFEVDLAATTEGAAIVEGDYSSMPHQRWRLEDVGDGIHFQIVNVWSGLVLGLDGADVVQQTDSGALTQQWKINYETYYPKKGQASHFHFNFMFKPSWAYDWAIGSENEIDYGQYYPMQWGNMSSATAGILRYQPTWYGRANNTIALGFNEPDNSDQSNISAETAIYQWPRMQRMRLPLGGPAPDGLDNTWRQTFEALAAEQGLHTDYMIMHEYEPLGANTGSPSTLFNRIEDLYNTYGKPIMLTEFAVRDFAGDKTTWSRNHNYNWLAEFMWRAESVDYLKGWSVFEFGSGGGDPATTDGNSGNLTDMNSPRLFLHFNNDKTDPGYEDLAECGLLLAGWDGDATVRNEKPYIIHNKGRFLRLIDDLASNTIGSADALNRDQNEQFVLRPASGNKKYIEGLSTGRRLSYNGSSVGLAEPGSAGGSVEWQLNEHQYGWYYIDHPSTGTRLRITDANVINVANDSTTGDNLQFRFIVPAVPFEFPAEADGSVLVGYDFDATSLNPTNPTMLSSSVTATPLSSPMSIGSVSTIGDDSGLDGIGVGFGSIDELGCIGIGVNDATTISFAEAVAADNYLSFTVVPGDDRTLTLSSISFKASMTATTSVDEYAVADATGTMIGTASVITNIGQTGTYQSVVVDLAGTAVETITAATEFRIYAWGRETTNTAGTLAMVDKVVLRGIAGPVLAGYDFDAGSTDATEVISPHLTASALTSPMAISFPTTIGDNSGVDAEGLAFGNINSLGCVGIPVSAATTTSFAAAVAEDNYMTFTVTPSTGVNLDLSVITFKASTSTIDSVDEYAVTDELGNLIGSAATISTIGQTTTYQSVSVDLSGSEYQNLTEATTFRIYAWGRGTTSTGGTLAMVDKVTLHGSIAFNATPTAIEQTVSTAMNTPVDLTLTGGDLENDDLSYAVLSGPENGSLTGLAPNFTYTPANNYIGADSFTFTVSDGQTTSAPATVSISVSGGAMVTFEHTAGTTVPDWVLSGVTSSSALGGNMAGTVIADTIDQLSAAAANNLPNTVASDNFDYYFSYSVSTAGSNALYESIALDAYAKDPARRYQLSYIISGQPEVFITSGQVEPGDLEDDGNFDVYDFPDFITTSDVEFRVYWQGSASAGALARVYVDDFFINGKLLAGIDEWRQEHFGTTENTGDAADSANPDWDSMNNFTEFALGTNPTVSDSPYKSMTASEIALLVEYTRRKYSGYSIYAEWSPTLQPGSWDTVGITEEVTADDGEIETILVSVPFGPTPDKKFVRIVVE